MLLQSKNRPAGERTFFPMRGKIGPSGINDEAPKGRGKRWPSAAFWSQKQTHRKRNKCPTGNPFHHILIYYPFSFSSSNIGKKKDPYLQESKFLFQNIHILSPSHPHIGMAQNLHRFSQHFQIFNSQIFSSSRLLSHTILSFFPVQTSSAFKLFFSANAGHKKESQGVVSLVRH